MRQRCRNPKNRAFKDYGERGISICERWDKYANFVADMGECPDGLSLERIDNDKGYSPSNCCWATKKEQMRNQTVTRTVTIDGTIYIAKDLAERSGLKTDTIVERAKRCTSIEEITQKHKRVYKDGLALGGAANGRRLKAKTHCPRGHPYEGDNLYTSSEGWRRCRSCKNTRQKQANKRKLLIGPGSSAR